MGRLVIMIWLLVSLAAGGMIVAMAKGTARLRALNRDRERRRRPGRGIAGDMRRRP